MKACIEWCSQSFRNHRVQVVAGAAVLLLVSIIGAQRSIESAWNRIEASVEYGRPPHARTDEDWSTFLETSRQTFALASSSAPILVAQETNPLPALQPVSAPASSPSFPHPQSPAPNAEDEPSETVLLSQPDAEESPSSKLVAKPINSPPKVRANDFSPVIIEFLSGSTRVGEGDKRTLAPVVSTLKAHGHLEVLLAGFSDPRGSASLNESLRQQRARRVWETLRDAGVPSSQIVLGSREDIPQPSGGSPRRVEVWFRES
ncbi:MAG: OmpA family protein [Verrucomicrobiota bacterium]